MSIEANYIRAASSSHLEDKGLTPSDIDKVIAAGVVRESLGIRLIRLRANYDAFSAVTEGPVMMGLLRGYPETLANLHAHANEMAANAKNPPGELDKLSYKVLGLFLNPNCPVCDGTGQTGTYGGPRPTCGVCKGSKRRELRWTDDEDRFVRALQASMDEKISNALQVMKRWLKN